MAISVVTDLVDVNLSEAVTNYEVLGNWATAIAASPDTYVQSSNTVGGRVSANTGWAHTSLASKDFSVEAEELHIFQWLKSISIPQLDTKANGGLAVTISSDALPTLTGVSPNNGPTNSKSWFVGGNEDALSGWVCYVINPRSTPTLTLGSPIVSAIQRIGVRGKAVSVVGGGAVRPINVTFDATRYGTGLTYTGDNAGVPGTFANILATAMTPANAWGILTLDASIYFGAGKFNFGTTGQTAISSFKSIGQLFVWRNFPVAVTFYAWRIRGNATYVTTFQIGNYASGLTSDGNVVKGAGDPTTSNFATWTLDVGVNTVCNLYGSQFSELYRGTLQSTTSIRGCTFKNFGNITPNGATIDGCTFQDLRKTAPISATYGIVVVSTPVLTNNTFINCATAISWNVAADTNTRLDGSKFISGGTGHAIELGTNTPASITLTNVIFSGYGATGTTNAAIYNNSGKAITITITGGTIPTYYNGVGASTIVKSEVTLTIKSRVSLAGTEIRVYDLDNVPAGSLGTELQGVESCTTDTYAFNGSAGNVVWIQIMLDGYIEFGQQVTMPSVNSDYTALLIKDINV